MYCYGTNSFGPNWVTLGPIWIWVTQGMRSQLVRITVNLCIVNALMLELKTLPTQLVGRPRKNEI